MSTRRDVYQAIADPTRRGIIQLIAREQLHLNAIAEQFEMSRPAISQHIKILVECGLVVMKQNGRERYCQLKPDKLDEVDTWVRQCRKMWTTKFAALENHLENVKRKNKQS